MPVAVQMMFSSSSCGMRTPDNMTAPRAHVRAVIMTAGSHGSLSAPADQMRASLRGYCSAALGFLGPCRVAPPGIGRQWSAGGLDNLSLSGRVSLRNKRELAAIAEEAQCGIRRSPIAAIPRAT
jgi:hypothetical protein